jgi:hypothetical protein
MARTTQKSAFLFGKRARTNGQPVNNKLVNLVAFEVVSLSWLNDDEYLGRDPVGLSTDLYVATGYDARRRSWES